MVVDGWTRRQRQLLLESRHEAAFSGSHGIKAQRSNAESSSMNRNPTVLRSFAVVGNCFRSALFRKFSF
jgi:hypothetical protein